MPEESDPNEYREEKKRQESRPKNKLENVISEVDNIDMLAKDLLIENDLKVQELISNIEKYIYLVDQPVITENALTDQKIIKIVTEALEKVIKFQKSFEVRKGFNEKELK
ncbi:9475_t:CDS:2, partial [Cetraspora pellucida]